MRTFLATIDYYLLPADQYETQRLFSAGSLQTKAVRCALHGRSLVVLQRE